MDDVIDHVSCNVQSSAIRQAVYEGIICAFWAHDADTLEECTGIDTAYDEALRATGYLDELNKDEVDAPDEYYDLDD